MAKRQESPGLSSISWIDDKDWIYTPTQDRSKKTLQRILDTARELFLDKGFEQTTIAEISRGSGVSVGSIYHRFADKNAIFQAIHESYRHSRVGQINHMIESNNWEDKTAFDVIRFHIEIIFSSTRKDARFLRLVETQRIHNPIVHEAQTRWDEEFCDLMLELYRKHTEDFSHEDLATAVHYVHYVIRGSALWSILPSTTGGQFLNISNKRYQEETIRMACGYLGLDQ